MNTTKKLVYTAIFIAIGIVLPMAFHSIPQAGSIILPMHLTVLLCGLVCGALYGGIAGVITPLLGFLLTGMPPVAVLPSMLCELAVYGIISGLMISIIKTKNQLLNVVISLVIAMIVGRIIYGTLNALIFQAGKYSFEIWLTASFVKALPGIVLQFLIIPSLVVVLNKYHLLTRAN